MSLATHIKTHPFIASAAAVIMTVAGIAGGVLAWGPDRPLFTSANPASYITFNSIKDNVSYGNETNFFRVKPADAPNSAYSDKVELEPGKEYQGYVYFHNNAAANLNLVATDTKMRIELPAVVDGDTISNAFISSPDAKPVEVFDDVTLTSKSAMAIRMVPGSATIHSQGAVNGQTMPDSLITSGTYIGYDALDGKVPGCNDFAGYVLFRFVADQPNFTVSKEVSKHGENKWAESYKANPGETVDFLLEYKNTGTTVQNNVVIKDELPAGMTYVAGSTKLGNPSNPQGTETDDTVTTTGLNIGSYNPGQNAWVIFSAKVNSKDKLECGTNTLKNKLIVETNNGSKSDTADVVVDKECQPEPPKTEYRCDLLEVKRFDANGVSFNVKWSQSEGVTKKSHVVRVYDAQGKEVYNTIDNNFKTLTPGEYTIKAFVTFTVNGTDKEVTSEACATKRTIPESGKETVCELETKKVITIDEGKFDASKHSRNLDDCQETPVVPEEPSEPSTPSELPRTGAADGIVSILGLSALTTAIVAYVASRRSL